MDFPRHFGYQRSMIDFASARANMIASQIRPNAVTDPRLIDAMAHIPRENFVPAAWRHMAYMDGDIPLKAGRYLMEPMPLARLIQLAAIGAPDHVLHVGCATGYGSAILAALARHVTAIDEDPELLAAAAAALAGLPVATAVAPHAKGLPANAPYDAIVVDGRIPSVPGSLLEQLRDGGRLVAIVGESDVAPARFYVKHGGNVSGRTAFEAAVMPLPGFIVDRPAFVF